MSTIHVRPPGSWWTPNETPLLRSMVLKYYCMDGGGLSCVDESSNIGLVVAPPGMLRQTSQCCQKVKVSRKHPKGTEVWFTLQLIAVGFSLLYWNLYLYHSENNNNKTIHAF